MKALPQRLDATLLHIKEKVKEEGQNLASPKSAKEKEMAEQQRKAEKEHVEKQERENEVADRATQEAWLAESSAAASEHHDAPKLSRKSSKASSTRSKASKKSAPKFDPPAAAGTDLSDEDDDDDDGEEEELAEHAFDHPSTYVEQPWIWIPKDGLGLSALLVNDFHAAGVDASDLGATMDDHSVVNVTRNPPDQEWEGGHDN
jgi:hypothetical protein